MAVGLPRQSVASGSVDALPGHPGRRRFSFSLLNGYRPLSLNLLVASLAGLTLGCFGVSKPSPPNEHTQVIGQTFPTPRFTNHLGLVFVAVPGTSVRFCIWETRVRDFRAFVRASGYAVGKSMYVQGSTNWELRTGFNWQHPGFLQTDEHPVVGVNWQDARVFCDWLTRQERGSGQLAATQLYRLPTDAEWSLAVGLTNETGSTPHEKFLGIRHVFPWGTNWPPTTLTGNFAADLELDPFAHTAPVGSFRPNFLGLCDLAGNVAEWCEDWWDAPHEFRVLRGSTWNNDCITCLMSSYRFPNVPDMRNDYYGFRIVLAETN